MATRRKKKSRARKGPKRKMTAAERSRRSRAAKKSIRSRKRRADGTLAKGRARKTRKSPKRRAKKSAARKSRKRKSPKRRNRVSAPLGGLRKVGKRGTKALKKTLGAPYKRSGKSSKKGALVATVAEMRAGKQIPPTPAGYLRFFGGNGDLRQSKLNTKGGTKGRRYCRK